MSIKIYDIMILMGRKKGYIHCKRCNVLQCKCVCDKCKRYRKQLGNSISDRDLKRYHSTLSENMIKVSTIGPFIKILQQMDECVKRLTIDYKVSHKNALLSALRYYCGVGNLVLFRYLFEIFEKIDKHYDRRKRRRHQCYTLAIKNNHLYIIKYLESYTRCGAEDIRHACKEGRLEIVKFSFKEYNELFKSRRVDPYDINKDSEQLIPLIEICFIDACSENQYDVVTFLLDNFTLEIPYVTIRNNDLNIIPNPVMFEYLLEKG